MMTSFGKEIGKLIQNERNRRAWTGLELIGKAHPKADTDRYPSLLSQLSRLEKGASKKPTPKVYRPYCDALGISPGQTEVLRENFDQKGMPKQDLQPLLGDWPDLCTDGFPETLVCFDCRNEQLGVDLITQISRSYQGTEEKLTSYVNGHGLHSPRMNLSLLRASLTNTKIPVKIGPKFLAYQANDVADAQLLSFVKSQKVAGGAKLFNSRKVRLSSDVKLTKNSSVYLSETDYCSSLLTDQLSFQQVYHDVYPKKWIYNGFSYFYDDKAKKILPFEHANRMGWMLPPTAASQCARLAL